jgi:hypothetical protein
MQVVLRYKWREVTSADVDLIRQLVADNPGASRRALSFAVCEAWNWKHDNGAPRDAVCRGLLLELHRAGHIELPAPRWASMRPRRHEVIEPLEIEPVPLEVPLSKLGPLRIDQVRRTPDEALVKSLIAQYHYLGYVHPVGQRIKYLIRHDDQPIACFTWSSAPRHLGPRDRYIGWDKEARRANVRYVAYQSRFLILPWVKVPHLASHLLGHISRRLSDDWQQVYAHPIYFTETFVDAALYRGTCYRAANWTLMGETQGLGKDNRDKKPNRSIKQVFGYPLVKNFRQRLCAVQPS